MILNPIICCGSCSRMWHVHQRFLDALFNTAFEQPWIVWHCCSCLKAVMQKWDEIGREALCKYILLTFLIVFVWCRNGLWTCTDWSLEAHWRRRSWVCRNSRWASPTLSSAKRTPACRAWAQTSSSTSSLWTRWDLQVFCHGSAWPPWWGGGIHPANWKVTSLSLVLLALASPAKAMSSSSN